MYQRSLARRLRALSISPKQVAMVVIVVAMFVFVVMILGQTNTTG